MRSFLIFNKVTFLIFNTAFIVLLYGCCTFSGSSYDGQVSDHYDGEEFYNYERDNKKNFWDFIYWRLTRSSGDWNEWTENTRSDHPPAIVEKNKLRLSFINHSTFLLQFDSINVITDPVYSDVLSPLPFIGPTRRRPPGIEFENLPKIDYVLLSHNHYDHMDMSTMDRLKEEFDPVFIVPIGNKEFLQSNGFNRLIEMDWWGETTLKNGSLLTCTPARHFANRGLCDRNTTLWCSYTMQSTKGPIYFAGDTGYGKHFKLINQKFGKMRLALIPIGAYTPRWFMEDIHVSPKEAVAAHIDLQSQLSVGTHYGTFPQADDGQFDPIKDLIYNMKSQSIPSNEFIALKQGWFINVP